MRKSTTIVGFVGACVLLFAGQNSWAQPCPITSTTSTQSGISAAPDNFPTFANQTNGGVIYNSTVGVEALELRFAGAAFNPAAVDTSGAVAFRLAAVADVDNDGWDDIVAGRRGPQTLQVLTNANQLAPPTPTFTPGAIIGNTGNNCSTAIIGGDFNGDNLDDVVRVACTAGQSISRLDFFANTGTALGGFVSAHAAASTLGDIERSTTSMVTTDWNGDGCLDILFGNTASASANVGQISVLVNDCAASPTFNQTVLIANIPFADGPASLGYADFDGDGFDDLVASSPSTSSIVMWASDGSGGFQPAQTLSGLVGNAQGLWAADLSLDGFPDIIWSEDTSGRVFYWENEGDGTPFDASTPVTFYTHGSGDLDAGALLDYDHDADNTLDLVVGDVSGGSSSYFVMQNGTSTVRVQCGEVVSGAFDLGSLASQEFGVKSARVRPTQALNGGTINYFMSNTTPETWVAASPCVSGPGQCASFPTASGRTIKWRAVLCRDSGAPASTPRITSVQFDFDYIPSATQFAAGVVASNGIAYVGGFQDVADTGKFFALAADLTTPTTLWEAGAKIDAQASRSLFTTENLNSSTRIGFSTPASTQLQDTLSVPGNQSQADAIVNWHQSQRFGEASPTAFGAVVNSTAAVLTPPGLPGHYTFLSDAGRAGVDAFVLANAAREVLVFFASKAGVIHALFSDPNDVSAVNNGEEIWGFIPYEVANNFSADYNNDLNNVAYVSPTRYMDGAPSLADIWNGSNYVTNLITGGGEGATVISSLDVTNTFAAGPNPLWSLAINNAGNVTSKPAVIRVDDGTDEGKTMIVAASGISDANPSFPWTHGRRILGLNVNGSQAWFFDAICPVTTDITAFETDDGGSFEIAGTDVDGFVDHLVFADFCGNVYMINANDPALTAPVAPPALATTVGPIVSGSVDANGAGIDLLFRTSLSAALGEERPIVGGIAARPDSTTDVVLYFGTGGHEQVAPTLQNEFYAVFAKNGTIRSKLAGTCGGTCEKFYGGTVVTETQVIFTATKDPVNGICDDGETRLLFADTAAVDPFDSASINEQLISSAVVSPVFAAANALYITTVTGEAKQFGETTMPTPGSNPSQATSTTDSIKGQFIAVSSWRQVVY